MAHDFDLAIANGLYFDGTGAPGVVRHLGIRNGAIAAISATPLAGKRTIDAGGKWVTPGFIDLHTHYDAEVELAPSLSESVRHGVTTVLLGSCSLSLAIGTPEDLADMYCRVEAIPYDVVRPLLDAKKTWSTLAEYFEHLESIPLGPNIGSFLGHSALRAHVMGIDRSLKKEERPTSDEMAKMERLVHEGLDLGYLGVSIQTLPWDKMGGDRWFRSRPLPSTFARWSEYRRLTRILRRRGKIFQGVPNVSTKWNVILFLLESAGIFRRTLKTTVISMMDIRAHRGIYKLVGAISRMFNTVLRADFKWQALPEVFDLWADGIDLVVFEEFGAGAAALHLQEQVDRAKLLGDEAYRARFRREWKSKFLPKVFHRDFNQSEILACPGDPDLVGKSFTQIAEERKQEVCDVFLDLVAQHGTSLRWYTVMANDRERPLQEIIGHPDVLIGFSDAGAHLRNMAHYNYPLRMLRLVRNAELRGAPFMTVERAVHRLTGEIGDWLGLDAGTLGVGRRADVCVIDPRGLDDSVESVIEAPIEGFGEMQRLVRRNDAAVSAVVINGKVAVENGVPVPALGVEQGYGRLLRAAGERR